MKTFTIQFSDDISLDIQWLHGWMYKALNLPGIDGYVVEIKDSHTLNIEKEKTFSDISVTGAMFEHLHSVAKSQGKTLAQLIKELER
jgi:hypothetical protein